MDLINLLMCEALGKSIAGEQREHRCKESAVALAKPWWRCSGMKPVMVQVVGSLPKTSLFLDKSLNLASCPQSICYTPGHVQYAVSVI